LSQGSITLKIFADAFHNPGGENYLADAGREKLYLGEARHARG
jgi:hypothetical protein